MSGNSVSRCATGSAPSGSGGKMSNTLRSTRMRGINGAPDLPLGGISFHRPSRLQLPQGPHTVPRRHPRPHVLVQPTDVVLRARVPASLQAVLHERHMAADKPLVVAQQPTRYLPRSPPRPRLTEERPRDRRRPGGGPRPLQGARKPRAWSPW